MNIIMNFSFKISLIIFLLPWGQNLAHAQSPFGVRMSQELGDLVPSMVRPNGFFQVENIPSPNSEFIHYFVKHHKASGVCAVIGGTEGIEGFGPGEAIRQEFNRLKKTFEIQYGKTKTYDFVTNGDRRLWEENFISKMSMGEAFLGAIWDFDRGSENLGPEIKRVILYVKKEQGYFYNILAFYELNNINECRRNLARDKDPMVRVK